MSRIEIDLKKKELDFIQLSKKDRVVIGRRLLNLYMCDQCKVVVGDKLGHTQWHIELLERIRDGDKSMDEIVLNVKQRHNFV